MQFDSLAGVFARDARSLKARILATASITALSLTGFASPSLAQPAQASQSAAAELEEITVTGSRIVRDGYEAPTPVSVLGADQINSMAATNIADAVNRLPAFSGGVTPRNASTNVSTGTGGVNHLNLRGLGPTRTLVLLDGKRVVGSTLAGFDNNGSAADVNSFPNGLIARVDVVTGGASAVYGSDALAGVVNFVLDKEFTGVKGDIEGGITTYGDDEAYKASVSGGAAFAGGKGHFLIFGETAYNEGIPQNNRPWADISVNVIDNPAYGTGAGQTTGVPQYLVAERTGLLSATRGGLITACAGPGITATTCPLKGTMFLAGGAPAPFQYGPIQSGVYMVGGDWRISRIDLDPMLDIRLTREVVFSRVAYDITDNINAFFEFGWGHTRANNFHSVAQFKLGNLTIKSDNAFIPDSIRTQMTARGITGLTVGTTNGDMPNLQALNGRHYRRWVGGLEGSLAAFSSDWKWDAYYEFSSQHISVRSPGNSITPRYNLAIDAVRNAAGAIVCRINADAITTNDDPNCSPYNVFGIGVNSAATMNYVIGVGYTLTKMTQSVAAGSITGEPFQSWAGPVSVALNVEHRKETVGGFASALDETNAFFAGNYHASHGSFSVTEGALETVIPLAKGEVWAKALDLNAAVRATDYSTSGYVTTWKAGLSYQPIDDFRLRATRSRDIRAPNLGDLYNAGRAGTGTVLDRFNNNRPSTIVSLVGGNPNLLPERADTTGVGAVFSPSFLSGFQASVDYYSIKIKGAISSLTTQQYVDRCFEGVTQTCAAIGRDANGVINSIGIIPANILSQETNGVDFEASYTMHLSDIMSSWGGDIRLRGLATKVMKLDTIDSLSVNEGAGINADGQGLAGSGGIYGPGFKWNVSASYMLGAFTGNITWRGIGAGKYNNTFIECTTGCPVSTVAAATININAIPAVHYFDLSFSYKFLEESTEAFFVIENALNRDPPFLGGNRANGYYGGQGNSNFYDRIGRNFRAGMRFRL